MEMTSTPGSRLTRDERARIEAGRSAGETDEEIAAVLGRHRTTITREVRSGGGRDRYHADKAHQGATKRGRRARLGVLAADPVLAALVLAKLKLRWSPHAIVAWLRTQDGPACCTDAIYAAAFANDDAARLLAGTWKLLPSARRRRRARGRVETRLRNVLGPIINVSERPQAAADRSEAGHWEGDLIKGANNRSAVVTLVERVTRFTLLGPLWEGATAPATLAALVVLFDQVPAHLRLSLTWDQGREMAAWEQLQSGLHLPVFFCDPHAPWQRPTNEHTNGLLRRWLPKGTDLCHYRIDHDTIATNLNTMPRRIHNWQSPANLYHDLTCNNR